MNWWQTLLISLATSLLTAGISFIRVSIYNKKKSLKFYVSKYFVKENYFRAIITVYNPSNIAKFFQNLFLCLNDGKDNFQEIQLETHDEQHKNSLGEIQCYHVLPTMIKPKEMIAIPVSCTLYDTLKMKKIILKYKDYNNKIVEYTLFKFKENMSEIYSTGKIDF